MEKEKKELKGALELRRKAEERLKAKPAPLLEPPELATQKLIQELRVHQIELEMQNEELRRTQTVVEESRAKYSDLYDFAPVGYLTLNRQGMILEANLTACSQLGKERSFLININNLFANFIIKKVEKDLFYQHLEKIFEAKSLETCELELKGNGNTKFYAQLESVVVKDDLSQCRTAITDITERKRAQDEILGKTEELKRSNQELEKKSKKLEQLDQLKDDFVSTVSHELRTPLTTMKEFVSIVLDEIPGKINKEQKEYLNIIHGNIDRLARIIANLLDISKIEAKKMELKKTLVNIETLAKDVVSGFKAKTDAKHSTIETSFPKALSDVYIDADRITQVFTNLIDNAIKFTPEKGKIVVEIKTGEKEIECSVSDTGIGIAPGNRDKLFEKFVQIERTAGPGTKGTGLGLAIIKDLVQLHNGKIWVESSLDKGSRFIFTLPKITAEEIFKEYVMNGFKKAKTADRALSVLVMHVNHLGELKEEYGDEGVRRILGDLETTVKKNVRHDFVSVHKKSSIVIILEETDKKGALVVQKRIADAVEKYEFKPTLGRPIRICVTFGMATYPEEVMREKEMIPAAGERGVETKAFEKTILIVDDEKDSVEAIGERLKANGYKILKAYNGEEALKIVETDLPDLVISDIKMPVLDGYGLLKKMKENKRLAGIPVIFLSGKEREFEDRVDGITQGAVRYFLKPYDETDFLGTIKLILKK